MTSICVFFSAFSFFVDVGKRDPSAFMTLLRYLLVLAALSSVTALFCFVILFDSDDQDLQMGIEILFFVSATIFLILSDVILRILQQRSRFNCWVYEIILVFFVLSFIGLRVLTMIITLEEAISMTSVLEYGLYSIIIFKFFILGWEIYGANPSCERKLD
jgi:hypothetical protein